MPKVDTTQHNTALHICYLVRNNLTKLATEEDADFLSRMAGEHACNESVTATEYQRMVLLFETVKPDFKYSA